MQVRDAILKLGNYKPPLEGRNPDDFLLMDFNESPVPPPNHVIEAMSDFIQSNKIQAYPSYGNILEKLGNYAGLPEDHVIITNGSDQAIDIILRALLSEGDEMVMAKPGFAMFSQVSGTLGATCISPSFKADMKYPLEEVMESVSEKTRLIVVINPNNPTGTSVSKEQLITILEAFPGVAVLVDEAYYEFTQETAAPLILKYPNLIVTRTFSKAFAIPSLRLGYALGRPEFLEHLYKIRGPYDVNMLSVVAAHAQLDNPEKWRSVVDVIMTQSKPMLENFFRDKGVKFYPGAGNFMLVEPDNVVEAIEYLKENKILVRAMRSPIEHTFRMSVGTQEACQRFIEVYSNYLEG